MSLTSVSADQVRAAGCFVATPHGVLLTVGRFGGKLQLPGGRRSSNELPRATAVRETLEETGVQVAAGRALLHRDRFVLFECRPLEPLPSAASLAPLDYLEVQQVLIFNPLTGRDSEGREVALPWRFPDDRLLVRALFRRVAAGD